jgi:hypothetical protein
MGKKNFRTWDEAHRVARKGAERSEEGGRHTKYYGPNGVVVLSRGKGDIGNRLRAAIIKQMIRAGILVAILTSVYSMLGG